MDSFVALTNMDEENILLSLFAKKHVSKKVITKINRQQLTEVIRNLELDSVVYPKLCFVDVSYGVMPKEAKDELEAVLDEDELELLYENSAGDYHGGSEDKTEYVYEFKIFRFLNKFLK